VQIAAKRTNLERDRASTASLLGMHLATALTDAGGRRAGCRRRKYCLQSDNDCVLRIPRSVGEAAAHRAACEMIQVNSGRFQGCANIASLELGDTFFFSCMCSVTERRLFHINAGSQFTDKRLEGRQNGAQGAALLHFRRCSQKKCVICTKQRAGVETVGLRYAFCIPDFIKQ
jgi:hypothetical protein